MRSIRIVGLRRGSAPALALAATLSLVACGGPATGTPDAGTGDGGPSEDGGPASPPPGPEVATTEALGDYLPARGTSLLLGRSTSVALLGTQATVLDPTHFGLGGQPGDVHLASGLLVLDRATGQVRVLGVKEGLPKVHYADEMQDYGDAAPSFFDLAWVEPDRAFVAAGWGFVVRGDLATDGTWSFRSTTVRAPGAAADALVAHVALAGGRLYAGTDQGLAILDPSDLTVQGFVDLGDTTSTWVFDLSAGTFGDGELVAALLGVPGQGAPDRFVTFHPGDAAVTTWPLPAGTTPTTLRVLPERVLLGLALSDERGAIYTLEDRGSGPSLDVGASPLDLVDGSGRPVVPGRFAIEPGSTHFVLAGKIVSGEPGGPGGGLLELPYSPAFGFGGPGRDLIDRRDPGARILPWQATVLAFDADENLWIAGQQLCSESKFRTVPLLKVELGTETRLVRPWVSGVRAIADGPDGTTWLGLRDEKPGLACDGISVSQGPCRLRADGSCEIYVPYVNANEDAFDPTPGVTAFAFGDPARKQLALATDRAALFYRTGDLTRALPTQLDPGLNLHLTSAAFGEGGLWIGSIAEWEPTEDATVNARGPQGLGWIGLGEDGAPTGTRRYTRLDSDNLEDDVSGLPSSSVLDVLSLGGTRAAAALGVERRDVVYDHLLPDAADDGSAGGLVIVDGATVRTVAAPEDAPFTDVTALARGGDGTVWALDAGAGLYRVDPDAAAATRFAAPAWGDARALDLAVDGAGRLAVATTAGLWVYGPDGGVTPVFGADDRWVWSVHFVADGVLYAGTDRGLVRVALDDASLPPARPDGPLAREPWDLPLGCYGDVDCACVLDAQCGPGLACGACTLGAPDQPSRCFCTPADPCAFTPGQAGCACDPDGAFQCRTELACAGDPATGQGVCAAPQCDGTAGCDCLDDTDCASGFHCEWMMGLGQCTAGDACLQDCTCAGDGVVDGCPAGTACQSGLAGSSCVEVRCEDTCSCAGPDATADGCPTGWSCVSGPMGSASCQPPAGCEDTCSCTGPDATADGCPLGWSCLDGPMGPKCAAPAPGP